MKKLVFRSNCCVECGIEIEQKINGRPRKFCSTKCKSRDIFKRDPEKYRSRARKHFNLNKDKISIKQKEKHKAGKRKAVVYLGDKCCKCGQVFPDYVYDIHHLDPNEKEFSFSSYVKCNWEKIVKELDKCVLLCANCHRIEHHGV